MFQALWNFVQGKRGKYLAKVPTGPGEITPTHAPRLTNGEVITVVMAWMPPTAGIRRDVFPLWGQFAAAAYDWNPKTGKLNTSTKNRDDWYPDVLLVELWKALMSAADDLDAANGSPRIDMDGRWDDIVFQGQVRAEVSQDSPITVQAKIPLPGCKRADGSFGPPKCKRISKRYPYLCEEWDKCDPVTVKDPITVVRDKASGFFQLALLVGAFWLLFDNKPRPRRRTRARR